MTTIKGRNFATRDPIDEVRDGDTLEDCNLAQAAPGTEIFKGVRGLTFRRCNLARAVVPEDATIEDCNTSQRPLPPEAEPEEMIEIERAEYDALLADREKLRELEEEARRD